MELPKHYNFMESEPKWMNYWKEQQIFKFNPEDTNIFSIDTPPPTISGKMHMGHAFGNSQQDFVARYKRMKGFNVLQPLGTDDNGLPTQTLIKKLKKVNPAKMDRKEFRKLCRDTLQNELREPYIYDWKRLGISCDYDVNYSTVDKHCQKISHKSFIDLYKMGRAYRTEAATMWCPACQTAISQVELVDRERHSYFNDIIFKTEDKDLIIATTRPELLPACVAVFYHPEDKRYQHLKGKKAKVPLFNFEVPILEDEKADPEKGTGLVMCCTFGDQTDMEWQKKHNLPIKKAIDMQGNMTDIAQKYKELPIEEARKQIINDLKQNKLLTKQEKIIHVVNCHERCDTPIEFIHSKQWFIKYLDLKDKMLEWGDELNWYPEHMKNRYNNWVNGLQWDWCISRQIHFGIPFPVWYCEDCQEVILANEKDLPIDPLEDKPPVEKCPKCGSSKINGEKDIINTWATSSLTPTIVKELFKDKPVYKYLTEKPMNLRPQGHDIISFWLFNTVVKSQLHFNIKPWHDCFINGWILDPKGKKMSKSKGNVVEPQQMINNYSADALRYMASGVKLGEDLPFPEKELVAGKKFITKLWNAIKFTIMNLEGYNQEKPNKLQPIDAWLLSKLNRIIKNNNEFFEKYEFFRVKSETEKLFWQNYCDFYLEIIKDRIYNKDDYSKDEIISAQYTLYQTSIAMLKIFSVFTPFITEELYHLYYKQFDKKKSIALSEWPEPEENLIDDKIEKTGDAATEIIAAVRKHKTEKQLSLKKEISKITIKTEKNIEPFLNDIKTVCNAKEVSIEEAKTIVREGLYVDVEE